MENSIRIIDKKPIKSYFDRLECFSRLRKIEKLLQSSYVVNYQIASDEGVNDDQMVYALSRADFSRAILMDYFGYTYPDLNDLLGGGEDASNL